jgi:hypothetical protein
MANSDRLKQIISNLQILTDLMNSMVNAEMYPVSFFSQAFDLIQKIQSDVHTLEADQVELFAAQMKKHQALILSIHQQMRNISEDTHTQRPAQPEKDNKVTSVFTSNETKTVSPHEVSEKVDEKSKKVSFLDRLGLQKKNNEIADQKNVETTDSSEKNTPEVIKSAPVIIEDAIKIPEIKDVEETPVMEQATSVEIPVVDAPEQDIPVVEPVEPITEPVEPIVAPLLENNDVETSSEKKVVMILNEKRNLTDLRKAFSLNDRFRYRKELFGGNEELMYKVIASLNNKESFKDSIEFIEEKLHWDFSDPIVKEFVKVLELRFL